jgi:hypothetical protein
MSPIWSRRTSTVPEFGKRVDQLTNMGRKEIMEASAQSNRFLDKPIRRMDAGSGVGADLGRIAPCGRRPGSFEKGQSDDQGPKLFGIIPLGQQIAQLFRQLPKFANAYRFDPRPAWQWQGRAA